MKTIERSTSATPALVARLLVTSLKVLCLSAILLWPAAYFGRPAFLDDTPGYDVSGGFALGGVGKIVGRLHSPPPTHTATAPGSTAQPSPEADQTPTTKGQRSISYGVLVHLLSGPGKSYVFLILAQAVLLAWMIVTATEAFAPGLSVRAQGLGALGLATVTTAPWIAPFAIPDVFAPIFVLGLLLLADPGLRLSLLTRLSVIALTAFAISAHASHAPVAVAMLAPLGLWAASMSLRNRRLEAFAPVAMCAVPIVLGLAATVAPLYIGFGEASVTAKRFPMALARSIEDGPARWYLDRECRSGHRYEVCNFFSPMPTGVGDFLWGPGGLVARADAEQMERIRSEEPIILENAVRAYPVHQTTAAAENFGLQLVRFRAPAETGILFDRKVAPSGVLEDDDTRPFPAGLLHVVQYGAVLAALLFIAAGVRPWPPRLWVALAMLGTGLVANAAICGILSAPADRYQARLIWLVPFAAFLAWSVRRRAAQP